MNTIASSTKGAMGIWIPVALILLCLPLVAMAQPTGITGHRDQVPSQCVGRDLARVVPSEKWQPGVPEIPVLPPVTDNWILVDSLSTELILRAGEACAVYFDPTTQSLDTVEPENELNALCWQAIDRAPAWLRQDLFDQLNHISYQYFRDLLAQLILDTQDPYVDEVAFCVAHTSRQLVGGGVVPADLLLENAVSIYDTDPYLDYAWLVDYGNSNDDDYWTTVGYLVKNEAGDTIEVELDRDVYYWDIVHPRLSDEIPTYIDPNTGQYSPPPTGVFWRDYLFNHADEGYPLLREAMEGCGVLWSHLWNNGTPENGAVGCVTQWINNVMDWGAGAERPIQPVRIYHLHCGNCGEYSDITAAAGRICLIPSKCTMAFCNDHTWNEFWGEGWYSWEPVNNFTGDSLAYEGWGHEFPTVFNYRGDGYVETVTGRYSEGTADLNITVTDAVGVPVDGVEITLKSNAIWGGLYHCTSAFTDHNGEASVVIGDERNIYLRLDSEIGHYPTNPDQVVLAVENSQAGAFYQWEHQLSMVEILPVLEAPDPPNPTNHYMMEISVEIPSEIVRESIWTSSEFSEHFQEGVVDIAVMDQENFDEFWGGQYCYGFEIGQHTGSAHVSFTMPTDSAWYAVVSNTDRVENSQCVDVYVNLYVDSEYGIPGSEIAMKPDGFRLHQNYPNPFNPSTIISYSLPTSGHTKLALYNLLGQEVAVLLDGYQTAGVHRFAFNGSDLASGTYFYRIEAGDNQGIKTMRLIK